jgi:hypothetical protein
MFGPAVSLAAVVCILSATVGSLPAGERQPATPAAKQAVPPDKRTLSPLHAFLGIDPETGEFRPVRGPQFPAAKPSAAALSPSQDASADAQSAWADMPFDETTLDKARGAIVKAIEDGDDKALADALLNVPRGLGYEWMASLYARTAWLGYALLFLYPLGIVLSEALAAWERRKDGFHTDRDRRYFARQRGRNLLMAACATGSIFLFWVAGEHSFFWDQPERAMILAAAIGLLLLAAAGLRAIHRRAVQHYSAAILDDLRRQQAALQDEVADLRKRLQSRPIADAIGTR